MGEISAHEHAVQKLYEQLQAFTAAPPRSNEEQLRQHVEPWVIALRPGQISKIRIPSVLSLTDITPRAPRRQHPTPAHGRRCSRRSLRPLSSASAYQQRSRTAAARPAGRLRSPMHVASTRRMRAYAQCFDIDSSSVRNSLHGRQDSGQPAPQCDVICQDVHLEMRCSG